MENFQLGQKNLKFGTELWEGIDNNEMIITQKIDFGASGVQFWSGKTTYFQDFRLLRTPATEGYAVQKTRFSSKLYEKYIPEEILAILKFFSIFLEMKVLKKHCFPPKWTHGGIEIDFLEDKYVVLYLHTKISSFPDKVENFPKFREPGPLTLVGVSHEKKDGNLFSSKLYEEYILEEIFRIFQTTAVKPNCAPPK